MATAGSRYLPQSDDICHKLGGTAEFSVPICRGGFFILKGGMRMRIMLEAPLCDEAMHLLEQHGAEVVINEGLEGVAGCDGALLTEGKAAPEALYDGASALRAVGILSRNDKGLDIKRATRAGKAVLSPQGGQAASVADYAFYLLLSLARGEEGMMIELRGKTLGLVGLPAVGAEIAQRAKTFGMEVLCFDPDMNRGRASLYGVVPTDLVDLFVQSDFVILLADGTAWSRALVGKDEIQLMPEGAAMIALTSTRIFDWDALVRALDWGYLKRFAIDLPQKDAHRARDVQKYGLVSIEQAANTLEAKIGNACEIARDLLQVIKGKQVATTVNVPRLYQKESVEAKAWCHLAHTLGYFMGQRLGAWPEKLGLEIGEDVPHAEEYAITASLLTGFAQGLGEENVNFVNAMVVSTERGLKLEKNKAGDDNLGLRLEVVLQDVQFSLAGTLHADAAVVTEVDGYQIVASPREHLLLVPHINRPGLVGQVGTLLGEKDVNIAEMVLGHKPLDRSTALMWIHIEAPLEQAVLDESPKLASVLNMEYIHLPNC